MSGAAWAQSTPTRRRPPECGKLSVMGHLRDEEIAAFAAALRQERHRLDAGLRERDGLTGGDDPGDLQDAAAEHASRTQASLLTRRAQDRLAEVIAALARIDAGVYGICEATGDPIPARRLALDPTTRCTVEASEEREEDAALRGGVEEEAY